ncbi:hypothetical protein DWF04_006100 [Cereibacter sphaeroides f. sp. denitrificans]
MSDMAHRFGARMPTKFLQGLLGDVDAALGAHLDTQPATDLHHRLLGHYMRELSIHSENRAQMEADEAFYDGIQWTAADAQTLRDRGQEPMVLNLIAQSINWMLGTEQRTRTDGKVLPRRKEGAKAGERKSQILKYLSDVNRSEAHGSKAFGEQVKAGVGWLEAGVQDEAEGEPIYDRAESWRNILWDSASREDDLSDARYLFRTKWVDLDTAVDIFPDRATLIEMSAKSLQDYTVSLDRMGDTAMDAQEEMIDTTGDLMSEYSTATRDRVRLIECWFRVPVKERRVSGGQFSGELYDEWSPGHQEEVAAGRARVTRKTTFRMFVAIFTSAGMLYLSPSPYRHNRFPLTPLWCYRRSDNGMPYGVVRQMRDAQADINKRFSKAQYLMNSKGVIMDKGAVDDIDDFIEEIARPDFVVEKNVGKNIEIISDRELAASQLGLLDVERGMIQSLSGITDENLGRSTNAKSGIAIQRRQDQGSLTTAPIFASYRLGKQIHGEKKLSLIEQFMTEEKQFRITNRRGTPEYITVMDGLPENDIVRTKADYILSEDEWAATLREAQVQAFLELLMQLAPVAPQIVMALLDLLVEAMDIPSQEEIVKRIRGLTGQEDPDADPNSPDPEREAREQAKAAQAEMEQRAAMAELAKLEGEAADKQAAAALKAVQAAKAEASLPTDRLAQLRAALETAIQMLQAEPAVDTADALLAASGAAPALDAAPMPAGDMPMPAEPQPQPQPMEGLQP